VGWVGNPADAGHGRDDSFGRGPLWRDMDDWQALRWGRLVSNLCSCLHMGDKELGGVMLPSSFGFSRCGLLENKVGGKVFPLTDGLVVRLSANLSEPACLELLAKSESLF
jgi:hypothetical protein